LSLSVYAKASADAASRASARAGGIQRLLTTRRFYGGRVHGTRDVRYFPK
jgi:hypothetical protein